MINADGFYVYEWYIVDTGEIFYVGKGSGNRATSMKDRNRHFKLIRAKHECAYRIVRCFDNEDAAYNFELEYGRELKARGLAKACYVLGNYGRMIDESVLRKMKPTQFKKNTLPWNKGKQMSLEQRKLLSLKKLGTTQSAEARAKRSAKLMNHPVSDDVRRRIAEARKKPIEVVDTAANVVKRYGCISDFANECGVSQSALSRVVKSGNLYRGRYIIKQVNPEGV